MAALSLFGAGKFGEFKFGREPFDGLRHLLEIDWDDDENFTQENEGPQIVKKGMTCESGREFPLKSGSSTGADSTGFEEMMTGRLTITLDNSDGRYDPRNTSSPLYPTVKPKHLVRYRVEDGPTGTIYPMMTGKIVDIRAKDTRRVKRVELVIEDGMQLLKTNEASIMVQENILIGDAVDAVLDDVNWPTVWGRNIETGTDRIPYWWVDSRKGYNEIKDLSDSEIGVFFVAADGKATFYGRHHLSAEEASIADNETASVFVRQPWEIVRKTVKLTIYPRVLRTGVELWVLPDVPYIKNGESLELWADFSYNNRPVSAKTVTDPVATTDYTMNTAEDGSGTDLTAGFTVGVDKFGQSAKVTISNASGSGGYVTLQKLRGDAIDSPYPVKLQAQTGDGEGVFEMDLSWMQNTNTGSDLAQFLASMLSVDSFCPVVELEDLPATQFGVGLMSKIGLVKAELGIDGSFRVGKVRHDLQEGGTVKTKLWLESPLEGVSDYWVFPTELGVGSFFAY